MRAAAITNDLDSLHGCRPEQMLEAPEDGVGGAFDLHRPARIPCADREDRVEQADGGRPRQPGPTATCQAKFVRAETPAAV